MCNQGQANSFRVCRASRRVPGSFSPEILAPFSTFTCTSLSLPSYILEPMPTPSTPVSNASSRFPIRKLFWSDTALIRLCKVDSCEFIDAHTREHSGAPIEGTRMIDPSRASTQNDSVPEAGRNSSYRTRAYAVNLTCIGQRRIQATCRIYLTWTISQK